MQVTSATGGAGACSWMHACMRLCCLEQHRFTPRPLAARPPPTLPPPPLLAPLPCRAGGRAAAAAAGAVELWGGAVPAARGGVRGRQGGCEGPPALLAATPPVCCRWRVPACEEAMLCAYHPALRTPSSPPSGAGQRGGGGSRGLPRRRFPPRAPRGSCGPTGSRVQPAGGGGGEVAAQVGAGGPGGADGELWWQRGADVESVLARCLHAPAHLLTPQCVTSMFHFSSGDDGRHEAALEGRLAACVTESLGWQGLGFALPHYARACDAGAAAAAVSGCCSELVASEAWLAGGASRRHVVGFTHCTPDGCVRCRCVLHRCRWQRRWRMAGQTRKTCS